MAQSSGSVVREGLATTDAVDFGAEDSPAATCRELECTDLAKSTPASHSPLVHSELIGELRDGHEAHFVCHVANLSRVFRLGERRRIRNFRSNRSSR